jgi:cell fate regulator YaaT (PSP1 superfamily)
MDLTRDSVNADVCDYVLSYGTMGDVGRFRPTTALVLRRGEQVVVRSYRGLELGEVLCEATPGHVRFLPNTTLGKLLRRVTPEDKRRAELMQERGQRLFEDGGRLVAELGLPLAVLDAEVTLDGKQGILHHLAWGDFDERDLVSRLSGSHDLRVTLHSLALPKEPDEAEVGCGRPDCGRTEGGSCGDCGSGGCSSCGARSPVDLKTHFANLREQMFAHNRTPLL